MASTQWIDFSVKALKFLAYIFVFAVVLGGAVIAKGTLLFSTSQIRKGRQISHCNKALGTFQDFITYFFSYFTVPYLSNEKTERKIRNHFVVRLCVVAILEYIMYF